MSNDQLIAHIKEMDSDIRRIKQGNTKITQELKNLDLRIKENKEKLALST